jgi:hypothetical protein
MLFGNNVRSDLISTGAVCNISAASFPGQSLKIIHTDGLSRSAQVVSTGSEKYSCIELIFCLPDYWDLSVQPWPKTWLEKIASIPSRFNTWIGPGDTIPAGKPPKPLTDKFKANHFIISEPIVLREFFSAPGNKPDHVAVLSVIPIFQQELDFKLRNSGTALLMRLAAKGITDEVDLYRKSVCRKRILGF